jgi:hypothetical protein
MGATIKTNMEVVMEQMNALIASSGGRQVPNKENVPPTPATAPRGNKILGNIIVKRPQQKKKLFPNCKTFVFHAPDKCYELEVNKDTHYPG